jgi:hypothetical protein
MAIKIPASARMNTLPDSDKRFANKMDQPCAKQMPAFNAYLFWPHSASLPAGWHHGSPANAAGPFKWSLRFAPALGEPW